MKHILLRSLLVLTAPIWGTGYVLYLMVREVWLSVGDWLDERGLS